MHGVAELASATAVWADIVGGLILAILAAGVWGVVSLLLPPKLAGGDSRRLEEEERRRERARSEKGPGSHAA